MNAAKKFEEQTGSNYSIRFVMLLLTERYQERFEQDITEIFDEKIRDEEERKARSTLSIEVQ